MSGERLRLASVSVLGGSLHGRRRDLEEVVAEVLVGSDPDCHLVVDLPSISPIHARLWTDLDQAEVQDTRAPRGVYVNTKRVEGQAILRPGDMLWLGPPQDPGSVCIQCRFEPWVEVLPGAGSSGEPAGVVADEEPAGVVGAEPRVRCDEYVLEDGAPEAAHAEVVSRAVEEVGPLPRPAPRSCSFPRRRPADRRPEPAPAPTTPCRRPTKRPRMAAPKPPPTGPTPSSWGRRTPRRARPTRTRDASRSTGVGSRRAAPRCDRAGFRPASRPLRHRTRQPTIGRSPNRPRVVESLPVPEVSDEFFVSEEPAGAAAFEPEVDRPRHGDTRPPGRAIRGRRTGSSPVVRCTSVSSSPSRRRSRRRAGGSPRSSSCRRGRRPLRPAVARGPRDAAGCARRRTAASGSPTPRAAAPVVSAPLAAAGPSPWPQARAIRAGRVRTSAGRNDDPEAPDDGSRSRARHAAARRPAARPAARRPPARLRG